MTDIAREAGCSQATVSFVLNRAPGIKISQQMRDRVIDVARTLGYSATNFADLEPELEPAPSVGIDTTIGFVVDQLATSPEAVVAIEGARQPIVVFRAVTYAKEGALPEADVAIQ